MSGSAKLLTAGGGGVSLTPASSIASDVTVNVPSQNCTLGIQGPAFSAYTSSGTSMTNAAFTKLQFQTKEFDTASCYDNSTNYRFTPNVAGYYQMTAVLAMPGGTYPVGLVLYKNGARFKDGNFLVNNTTTGSINVVTSLIYLNGSTDYVEVYGYQSSGGSVTSNTGASQTYFQGAMVRAA